MAAERKILILKAVDGTRRDGYVSAGSGSILGSAPQDALVARGLSRRVSERASLTDGIREAKELTYGPGRPPWAASCWYNPRQLKAIPVEGRQFPKRAMATKGRRRRT